MVNFKVTLGVTFHQVGLRGLGWFDSLCINKIIYSY